MGTPAGTVHCWVAPVQEKTNWREVTVGFPPGRGAVLGVEPAARAVPPAIPSPSTRRVATPTAAAVMVRRFDTPPLSSPRWRSYRAVAYSVI
jgi:hypothetical protein